MSKHIPQRLRRLRCSWGLTQREVAFLLSGSSGDRVSNIERGVVPPNVGEILAYHLLFGTASTTLLRSLYAETEKAIIARAEILRKRLQPDHSPRAAVKREFIDTIMKRAKGRGKRSGV